MTPLRREGEATGDSEDRHHEERDVSPASVTPIRRRTGVPIGGELRAAGAWGGTFGTDL